MSEIQSIAETMVSTINHKTKSVGRGTLIAIGVALTSLGVIVSYFFAQEVEKFLWEARTKSVTLEIDEVSAHVFKENYLARWQDNDARAQIEVFSKAIKREIPSVVAIKVFTTDATVAWSDLRSTQVGRTEGDLTVIDAELREKQIIVENAGIPSKEELGKTNLLEIYSVIKDPQGQIIGFIECYFDSSDISTFITETRYAISGGVFIIVIILIFLLRLTLRQQNDIIIRQAYELANLIEQSPVGIYTINTEGKITSINSKMLALIEESDATKILGKSVWDVKNIMRMNVAELTREALLGTPFDEEVSGDDKDGDEIHRHYRGTPLVASDGKTVEQVLFMVEDITEHVRLEKTVAKHTKALEEGVSDRTKELQDKIAELEQFQKLTVGREIRMMELKQENEELRAKLDPKGKE